MLPGEQVTKIGRYEIKNELGRGAMGVVYLGEDPTIGRRVALKTTRVDVHGTEPEELLKRLRQEARAAGVLNHPNIVTIYDAGEENGLFYIAMEYIEGTTLQDKLTEVGTLAPDKAVGITRQICAGLDYAHQKGIIHRDVKPANIMITEEGVVKIMDFGVAKIGGQMTSTGSIVGTPSYMSPEQVCGRALDGRTDLFSVGVILYECITGDKPFTGDNITTICYKIVHEEVVPPGKAAKALSAGINRAVVKALAKDPNDRYQRGSDLVRDLERAAGLGTVDGVPASSGSGSVVWEKSGPVRAAAAPGPALAPRASGPPPLTKVPGLKVKPAPIKQEQTFEPKPASSGGKASLAAGILVVLLALVGGGYYVKQNLSESTPAASAPATPSTPAVAPKRKPSAAPAATQPDTTATPDTTVANSGDAPSAPADPAKALLKVVTTPPGATVELDGKALSMETPNFIDNLDPGDHTVVITKPGYKAEKKTATLEAGKQKLLAIVLTKGGAAGLNTATATIEVTSTPIGADVTVDGQPVAGVTPTTATVSPGAHVVLVKKQGMQPAEARVNLRAGEKYTFAPELQGRKGLFGRMFGAGGQERVALIVRTMPRGAQVSIDGIALLNPTPMRAPIPAGSHHMVISLAGYQNIERDITVTEGQPLEIQERLRPQ